MKTAVRFLFVLIALLVTALLVIRFCEISLPRSALEYVSRRVSSEDWLVRVDSAKWSFPGKIGIYGLRIMDRKKAEAKPFLSAESIAVRLSLSRFPWKAKSMIRSVTVSKLKMPRLPDGYYIPDSIEFPGSHDFTETDEPVELDIPDFSPFKLTLIEPEILDLQARRALSRNVSSRNGVLRLDGVTVQFPDRDVDMEVTGECELDIPGQRVVDAEKTGG